MELKCENKKCGTDLDLWNRAEHIWINYCPRCGHKLSEKLRGELNRLASDKEIIDIIRDKCLEFFNEIDDGLDGHIDDLAYRMFEYENANGVYFCSDYKADNFSIRHATWMDGAEEYFNDNFGDNYGSTLRHKGADGFIVAALMNATEAYLYNQLGIDNNQEDLTKEEVSEIIGKINDIDYNCEW